MRRSNNGFTLIEILVAVLLMAIGLLGVASLQANSLRYSYSSAQRSQAVTLAQDIIDRMRANREWGVSDMGDMKAYVTGLDDTPGTGTDCVAGRCSAAELARYDLQWWKTSLADTATGLPGGRGAVCVLLVDGLGDEAKDPCTAPDEAARSAAVVRVTIQWRDDRAGASDDEQIVSFQTDSRL